jgi:hypothetical protein
MGLEGTAHNASSRRDEGARPGKEHWSSHRKSRFVRRLFRCVSLDRQSLPVGSNSDDIARLVGNGAAWVFRRDAGAWTAEAQLRAANGMAGDFFGTSVALAEPVDAVGAIGPEGGLALCGSIFDAPEGPPCACLDSVDTKNDEDARRQVRSSGSAATDRRSARCIGMRRRQCTRQVVWRLCNHPLIP